MFWVSKTSAKSRRMQRTTNCLRTTQKKVSILPSIFGTISVSKQSQFVWKSFLVHKTVCKSDTKSCKSRFVNLVNRCCKSHRFTTPNIVIEYMIRDRSNSTGKDDNVHPSKEKRRDYDFYIMIALMYSV